MTYEHRMRAKIGCDIDGTLLDYGHNWADGSPHVLNEELCGVLHRKTIHLITNQGGIPLALAGLKSLPTPEMFIERVRFLQAGLEKFQITIASLRVCVYHPKAARENIDEAVRKLEEEFRLPQKPMTVVYGDDYYRKPAPGMMIVTGISAYYGDSMEDAQAAQRSGIEFIKVSRFTKE